MPVHTPTSGTSRVPSGGTFGCRHTRSAGAMGFTGMRCGTCPSIAAAFEFPELDTT